MPVVGMASALLEGVCWDKDRFGRDYMGEFDVTLDEIFANGEADQGVRRFQNPVQRHNGPLLTDCIIFSLDGIPSNLSVLERNPVLSLAPCSCNALS